MSKPEKTGIDELCDHDVRCYPILFLDFDGVMHPTGLACLDVKENGRISVDRSVEELMIFLPTLTQLLSPYPEFRIVVSSTWRRQNSEAELASLLGPLGGRMVGTLFKDRAYVSRLHEILAYVNERNIHHWLALDDDVPFEDEIQEHFGFQVASRCIKTYSNLGLGWSETCEELKSSLERVYQECSAHDNKRSITDG